MAEVVSVFDFDKTLYKKDSLIQFHLFLMRRHPLVALWLPIQVVGAVLYKLKFFGTHRFKNIYLFYLAFFSEGTLAKRAGEFWNKEFPANFHKELLEIIANEKLPVVIVTASPELYLIPLLDKLRVHRLIGTKLRKNGSFYLISGHNCKGDEKVRRLQAAFGADVVVHSMYSDSMADAPLLRMAENPYLLDNEQIIGFK